MSSRGASRLRHTELADALLTEIRAGLHPVGGSFPTEFALRERFGVGRHTIREALKLLVEQGILGRRPRTGSVVLAAQPLAPFVHTLRDLDGLADLADATRLDVRRVAHGPPPEALRNDRGAVGWTGRWLMIEGVRVEKASNEPLGWVEIHVPEQIAPAADVIALGGSIYQAILADHSLQLGHVEQAISATVLAQSTAEVLQAEVGTPALLVERHYVSSEGATFEISRNIYASSRFSLRSVIRRRV